MFESRSTFETGQEIRDRTFRFACSVVRLCQTLYDAGGVAKLLAPQLINCSTSVAGMLEEARAAESRKDFISKCSIGLKECREAHVRLRIVENCAIGPTHERTLLIREASELVAILSAIVRNAKRKLRCQRQAEGTGRGTRRDRSRAPIPNS